MRKIFAIELVIIMTFGILATGIGEAQAMRTRDVILLGGVIAVLASPVIRAIAREIYCPPVYPPSQVIYTPAPAYIPRTAYERGMVDEQLRIERELDRYEDQRG